MSDITIMDRTDEPASKFTEAAPAKRPSLDMHALTLFEQRRKMFTCRVPAGVTPEDLRYQTFWKNVSSKMSRDDIVFVLSEDGSWEAEARVEKSMPDGAELSVVKLMKRQAIAQRQTVLGEGEAMTLYENGTWTVVRTKDRHPLIPGGHSTEGAAITTWLLNQPRKG